MIANHNITRRLILLNRYYKITNFYSFLKDTATKAGIVTAGFVVLLVGLELFVLDINSLLNTLVETFSTQVIFLSFLISETILGLVPPEIFIAWPSKAETPWLFLFILATMSYIGGIISYFIGNRLFLIKPIKNHIENKIAKHIVNLKKWEGLFVVIGAISPVPHSIVSLASGLIKYDFKHYLLWSLFPIYGLLFMLLLFSRFSPRN